MLFDRANVDGADGDAFASPVEVDCGDVQADSGVYETSWYNNSISEELRQQLVRGLS